MRIYDDLIDLLRYLEAKNKDIATAMSSEKGLPGYRETEFTKMLDIYISKKIVR